MTEVEPSYAEIGRKLISVGPGTVLVEISEFWMPTEFTLEQLQVVRLISITHFLELRDAERLYVSTRDLADATRGKTVVIEASGVLHVMTQRCVRAGSSHSI